MNDPRTFFTLCALLLAAGVREAQAVDIVVRPEVTYQTIVGFGGHDPRDQAQLLVNDLGLSAHRDHIECEINPGSKVGWNRLRELYDLGVRVFMATPWSPAPSYKWINNCSGTDHKWNRLSNGLGPYNDYRHPNADHEKGGLPNYYPAFADGLVGYVQEFERQVPGAQLTAISPQNECFFAQTFPSCVYEINTQTGVNQMRDIIWELGTRLESAGLARVKIIGAEDVRSGWLSRPYMQMTMADPVAAPYVGAIAVHGYINGVNPSPTSDMAREWGGRGSPGSFCAAKGLELWQTETSGFVGWDGGDGPHGYTESGAWDLGVGMFGALKYGRIAAWFWWRLAVTESYWTDEALVYNGTPLKQYYVSKHYYKHIRPGAVMIHVNDSAADSLGVAAFHHPGNQTLTVVVVNNAHITQEVSLSMESTPAEAFSRHVTTETLDWYREPDVSGATFTVPARSFTTLYGEGYEPPITTQLQRSVARTSATAARLHGDRVYNLRGQAVRTSRTTRSTGVMVGRTRDSGSHCRVLREQSRVRANVSKHVRGREFHHMLEFIYQ